jgi:hypothetical protein
MTQRRDYFRIRFPITQRPRLITKLIELDVIELSENGARVAVVAAGILDGPEPFDAIIQFKDGTAAAVIALVHRWEAEEAILHFPDNLSYSIIAAEQRRLLQMFPREAAK